MGLQDGCFGHLNPQSLACTGVAFKFSDEHFSFLSHVLDTLQSQVANFERGAFMSDSRYQRCPVSPFLTPRRFA